MRKAIWLLAAHLVFACQAVHTIRAGQIYAWGSNGDGQLGDGTTTDRASPVQVSGLSDVVSISAGGGHSLALLGDGTVWAWGDNFNGQIGDGTTTNRLLPVNVAGLPNAKAIAAGGQHSVALLNDGTVRAWGDNSEGQLGNGTITFNPNQIPVVVSGLSGIAAIYAGGFHSFAILSDQTVRTWGWNSDGQLGDGTTAMTTVPVTPSGLGKVTSVLGGEYHSLAIIADRTMRAWGYNGSGQLGDGTNIERNSPVAVTDLANVISIAAGQDHSVAALADGTVRAWGFNEYGQLGNGTTSGISDVNPTPTTVPGLSDIVQVAATYGSSFALSASGELFAWGDNEFGELGVGDFANRLSPTKVEAPSGYRFAAISGDAIGSFVLASVVPVPEPSAVVLTALGVLCLLTLRCLRARANWI